MIDKISAAVLFVRDLARCTTFYRDTLGLQAVHSDPTSVAFHLEDQDFLLLEVGAAAHMLSEDALELKSEGSQRVLLCAGVEDVDAAYEALVAMSFYRWSCRFVIPWFCRELALIEIEGKEG
jgi:lactoylglutathione lyase